MVSLLARGFAYVFLSATVGITGAAGDVAPRSFIPVAVAEAPIEDDGFVGYPTLKRICTCESGLTHYTENGEVLRGMVNNRDIGICQINEYYHEKEIEALGIDIYTREGNINFAKHLYDKQGSAPWVWSKKCWGK